MLSFDELEECIPSGRTIDEELAAETLAGIVSDFLHKLPQVECDIFLRRYFYLDSIKDICQSPASDFIARSSSDVLSEVIRTQVPLLIEIYRKMDRGEIDSEDAQYEAYSQCAGLTAFWTSPFHVQYDTADGKVLIRFRKRGEEIEFCTTAFTK